MPKQTEFKFLNVNILTKKTHFDVLLLLLLLLIRPVMFSYIKLLNVFILTKKKNEKREDFFPMKKKRHPVPKKQTFDVEQVESKTLNI